MTRFNERTHFFRKIYLSHFILERVAKRLMLVMCERWVGDGTDCQILTPSSSDHCSTSSSFCWATQPGSWGSKPSVWSCSSLRHLIPNWNYNLNSNCNCNLNWTQAVCGTWLYNCLTSTCFLWAYASVPNSTTSTGQGDIPTSSTGCTCLSVLLLIYTGASLDWQLGRGTICNIVLYPFCANLLHSFAILLIVSSLSPHNRHLEFSFILSDFA